MSQADDFSTENKLVEIYQKLIHIVESDPMLTLERTQGTWLGENNRLEIIGQIPELLQKMQELIEELIIKSKGGIHSADDTFFMQTNDAYFDLKTILQAILIDRNVPGAHVKAVEAFRALDFLRRKEDDLDDGGSDYLSSEPSAAQKQIDAISQQFHELEDKIKNLYGLYEKETPIKSLSIRGSGNTKSEEDDEQDENELVHDYTDQDARKDFNSKAVANAAKLFKSSAPFTNGTLYPNEDKLTLMQLLMKELQEFFHDKENQLEFTKALANPEYKELFRQYCYDKFCSEVDYTAKGYVMYNYGMDAADINQLFAKIVTDFSREYSAQQFLEGLPKNKRLVTYDSDLSDGFQSDASSVSTSDGDSTHGSPKPVTRAKHLDPIPELTGRQRSKSAVWIQHPGQAETKQRGRSNAVWKQGRGRSDAIDETKQGRQRSDAIDENEPSNTGETSGRKRRKSF